MTEETPKAELPESTDHFETRLPEPVRWFVTMESGKQFLFESDIDMHDKEGPQAGHRVAVKLLVGQSWVDAVIQIKWTNADVIACWSPTGEELKTIGTAQPKAPEMTHASCSLCWAPQSKELGLTDEGAPVVTVNPPAVANTIKLKYCCFCSATLAEKHEKDVIFVFQYEPEKLPCGGYHKKVEAPIAGEATAEETSEG